VSFGFLAPAALALGLLLAGPILAHLNRRPPNREQLYGPMILLRRLEKRLRRRRQVRDPLLLALRLLCVALVVAALTRPELRLPGAEVDPSGPATAVLVIDNSLSMNQRRGGPEGGEATLLAAARAAAVDWLRKAPEGSRIGLVTAGGEASRSTPELVGDHDTVAALVEAIPQSQGTTDLAGGLREARRMLGGKGGAILVFTDEAGPDAVARTRDEVGLIAAQGASLLPQVLRPAAVENLVVTEARYGEGLEGGTVRITVRNFGPSSREAPLVVRLPGGAEIAAFVTVPAEGEAEAAVTVPRVTEGGVATVEVQDPALEADNHFAFHLPRVGASRVVVVDGDPGSTPVASEVYFLERALAPWGMSGGGVNVLPEVTSTAGLGKLDASTHRVVFLANVADPETHSSAVIDFVRAGGGLVVSLGDNTTAQRMNETYGALLPSPLRELKSLGPSMAESPRIELPDTQAELFRPFSRGGRGSFTAAHVRKLFTVEPTEGDPSVRVLLRLQGGAPLLIERAFGRGKVLLWTSSIDLGWTDFPLQAAYMPWVQRLITYLGGEAGGSGERRTALVGEAQSHSVADASVSLSVEGPEGPVPAPFRDGALRFVPTRAGAYAVLSPGAPPLAWIAVNSDRAESDIRPGPALDQLAAELAPERYLRRIDLGPFLLAGALALALVQALISALLLRRDDAAGANAHVS